MNTKKQLFEYVGFGVAGKVADLNICASLSHEYDMKLTASNSGRRDPFEMTAASKDDIALITLKGYISEWTKASSGEIENIIKSYKEDGVTKAKLYINSGGGSVFEANEILNLLDESFEEINVSVGALAASAATLFIAKYPTTVKRNSKIMIHKPMVGAQGNEDEIKATLKMLEDATNDYRSMYAEKMSKSEADIEALWGNDYWMNSKEAKQEGLIDAIENEDETIDAKTVEQLEAYGAPDIPELTNNTKSETMKKEVLCAQLGLPADATEDQIKAKLEALKTGAAEAVSLKASAETDAKNKKSANIKALLDNAEKDKKIVAAQRTHFEALANADYDSTKSIIDGMQAIGKISDQLDPTNNPEANADRKNWTFADYQEKDQEAFQALPEATQTALTDAHYASND